MVPQQDFAFRLLNSSPADQRLRWTASGRQDLRRETTMDIAVRTARTQFESDGFYLQNEPLFPMELLSRAVEGMDAIRCGEYDTGCSPQPSPWNPGDDLNKLCKIE